MIDGKPIICIVNGSNHIRENGKKPRTLELTESYSLAFSGAGFLAVHCAEQGAKELSMLCDALCLSGGPDLEAFYFGEKTLNDTVKCDPQRARFEYEISNYFLEKQKPIFATCRGFQVLNCVLGGTLYQDLVEQLGLRHYDPELRHYVTAAPGSVFERLFGSRFKVNSTHHQAIKDLAPGFKAAARSDDGLIEAYEHETLPIIGTQFHPERLTGKYNEGGTPDFKPIYEYFANIVKNKE